MHPYPHMLYPCMLSRNRAVKIPGAGPIEIDNDSPGGGKRVTIIDPEGFPMGLISNQESFVAEHRPRPEKLAHNFEDEKMRINNFLRFTEGPAAVHKVSLSM